MTHKLTIENGDTYTIPENETETHRRAVIDGSLILEGSIILDGSEAQPEINAPTGIDIPMAINGITMVSTGAAVFIGMILALLLSAGLLLRNYLVIVMWAIAFSILIISALFSLGLEYFWIAIILTILMIVIGVSGKLYLIMQKNANY